MYRTSAATLLTLTLLLVACSDAAPDPEPSAVCGDGTVAATEACDDGNTEACDGCSSTCTLEACGDGLAECGEQCDDGNTEDGDGCSAVCALEVPACTDGETRACENTNVHGTCPGTEVCGGDAWGACSAPEPAAEACNAIDDDCDGLTDEDFLDDSGRYATDAHCGACYVDCADLGAGATCDAAADPPTCVAACGEGCVDLNGDPADGCECCSAGTGDLPDPAGEDADCDGVDGEAANAVFVASAGDDAAPGTRAAPKRTVQAGLDAAVQGGLRDVYVAAGVYAESVAFPGPVGLYGGYAPGFGARDPATYPTVLLGQAPTADLPGAVNAVDLAGPGPAVAVLDGFTVYGATPTTPGASSYAVYVRNAGAALQLTNNRIHAGNGAPGVDGAHAASGSPGAPGAPGQDALDVTATFGAGDHGCVPAYQLLGGLGAAGSCGGQDVSGGQGGESACPAFDDATGTTLPPLTSELGQDGRGPGGAGGPAGWDVYHQASQCAGYATFGPEIGGPGAPGRPGSDGSPGAPCGGGAAVDGRWVAGAGGAGRAGLAGGGGGGGGAGAGAWVHLSCLAKGYGGDNLGGSGGGGGAGGCGSDGGAGGSGGGASFGIFLVWDVPPTSFPVIAGNTVHGGLGGAGGDGGNGGPGAAGGPGGVGGAGGAATHDPADPTYPAFAGGAGGAGGRGGHGGGGAGGCGGPSYGLAAFGQGGQSLPAWTSTNGVQVGGGGAGGTGGWSAANPGPDGPPGAAAEAGF